MLSLTLKSIRANKVRFALTGVAVMLGVAFMSGTFVLTDTIKQSYNNVTTNVYKSTDAVVRSARHETNSDDQDVRGTISASMLARVQSVKGVQAAEAQQLGTAVIVGHNGALLDANRNRATPIALAWQNTPALNPMTLVSGHAPRAPDEIVIDRASQQKGHFVLGEQVHVVSQVGSQLYRIAGVATYGGTDSAAGAQVVAFTPATAARVIGTPGRYTAIEVVAAPGVSQAQVAANIRAALHDPTLDVITGAQAATEARNATTTSLGFVNVFLLTFALVALVVGSFVIYNTFSITVAQRTKETALLRAIGAKRGQVMRSIRLEAFFTGVIASAVGVALGIATAQGLRLILQAFGLELPSGSAVVHSRTIVVSMVTGVVVTVVAAWLPARKAAKVAPIEALRDNAQDTTAHSKVRILLGIVTVALGAVFMGRGLSGAGAGIVGLGALAVFVGVAMLGPAIARQFTAVVGMPLRIRGMAGTLARDNAMRNPRRTAATASGLMIGVALVAFITVFAASAKASVASSVDNTITSNWIVTTQYGMGGLSPSVAKQIDALPETASVTALRFFDAKVGAAKTATFTAVDPARIEQDSHFDMRSGAMNQLGLNDVLVQTDTAKADHLGIGSTVSMFYPETGIRRLHVVGTYAGSKDLLRNYVVSMPTFNAITRTQVDDVVVAQTAPGYTTAQARHAIENVLKPYPTADLMTRSEFKGSVANRIDQLLNLIYVLLAMALVIALFGIANTLALSVFERTRELGLLRAVGMSRGQTRATIRWESVLIALLGTTLGTAIGIGFGAAVLKAASSQGINILSIPSTQLAVIVLLAALAAVLAAALPARRAAKLDVLQAISE
jgi:putative ABC transport system permease protein